MERLSFKQLPFAVKIAVSIAFYNAWWSIEEWVIDRHGLWKYMPYFKVGDPCLWDLGVALIIAVGIWHSSRRGNRQRG
jgi:hypothetical protein